MGENNSYFLVGIIFGGYKMNGLLLIIPLILIRFGLLRLFSKKALGRAAYFAPLEGYERKVLVLYQISNIFLVLYPLALKIHTEEPLFIVGLLVYGAGVCLLVISTFSFARPKQGGINTSGIYKISRNPMYIGYFIYFMGCVLLMRSWLMFGALIIFIASTHPIVLSEERWCIHKFGDEYVRYMSNVRRYI